MEQISDEQLFALFQSGDERAFARLVSRYEKELYNFLLRYLGRSQLAEDVFQETFLQLHISSSSFETSRRLRPWLYTIAVNKARDALRRQGRHPTVQLTGAGDDPDDNSLWENILSDTTTPADLFDKKQQEHLVRRTVAELPDNLREILVMAYFNQFSYKQMAEMLDIPLGTVKSRLHAAVGQFACMYKQRTEKESD